MPSTIMVVKSRESHKKSSGIAPHKAFTESCITRFLGRLREIIPQEQTDLWERVTKLISKNKSIEIQCLSGLPRFRKNTDKRLVHAYNGYANKRR